MYENRWFVCVTSLSDITVSVVSLPVSVPRKTFGGGWYPGHQRNTMPPADIQNATNPQSQKPKCVVVVSYTTYDTADCSARDLKYPSAYVNVNDFIPGMITPLLCSAVFLWSNFYNLPRGHTFYIFFPPPVIPIFSPAELFSVASPPPLNFFFFFFPSQSLSPHFQKYYGPKLHPQHLSDVFISRSHSFTVLKSPLL